jgi:alpha-ketoglutarate-dependent taurine dioxygenase
MIPGKVLKSTHASNEICDIDLFPVSACATVSLQLQSFLFVVLFYEGCTGVGRTGWHIDGSFQAAPFAYSLYHMVSVPRLGGDTVFAPLTEILGSLPPEQRQRWERLWIVSDRRGGSVKPLIYSHPLTGLDTMCFHTGGRQNCVGLMGFANDASPQPANKGAFVQSR